jgi:hypothetical protein
MFGAVSDISREKGCWFLIMESYKIYYGVCRGKRNSELLAIFKGGVK